jgi:hypothetical protein
MSFSLRRRGFLGTLSLVVARGSRGQDTPRSLAIEGYTDRLSYAPGESAKLHVSTTGPKWSVEITRLGASPKVVWRKDDLPGAAHPIPEDASSRGCKWPAAVEVPIGADWPSGYYQIRFKTTDQGGSFVGRGRRTAEADALLVVRPAEPGKNAKILLQLSTNTYNAYNNWGGGSLYAYNGRGGLQGNRVSFERPPASQFDNWERPFVAWAEANGYALDYCVNSDLEFHPELLKTYKLVLSVGHDEYWSAPMRDNLEDYIAGGGNVAFLSGNTCCWQVRSEDGGKALTSWKQRFNMDPVYQTGDFRTLTTLWSHHLVQRPENRLTGVGFLRGGYHLSHGQFMGGKGSYTTHRPDHWMLAGTGLKAGDEIGGKHSVVGYECDGCELEMKGGLPFPTGRDGTPSNFEVVASCPARWHPDDALWYERFPRDTAGGPAEGVAVLGTYTNGGTVVTTGSTDWAHGLRGGDPVVERITRKVLDRLSS